MALGNEHEIWVRHRDWAGAILGEFRPVNLEFTLRNNEPEDISYDIPLAAPGRVWGFVGPKRTTFELWLGNHNILSGIHSFVNSRRGEEVFHVQGKGWLWYLDNRHYPFNGAVPYEFLHGTATDQAGLAYQIYADPATIITDLLDITLARPHSVDFTYSLSPVGWKQGFRIELADTTSLFQHINQMSQAEPGSFDFGVRTNREFWITSPHVFPDAARDDPSACVWVLDHFIHPEDLIESEFENNGPLGTHIVGLGAGTSSQLALSYGWDFEQNIFKRWDMSVDFPDVMTDINHPDAGATLRRLTQAHFSAGLYPQHSIPLTVKPDNIPDFWHKFIPGHAIWVRQDYEGQNIDGAYKLNGITGKYNTQGEAIAELDVEQINPQGQPGVEQG